LSSNQSYLNRQLETSIQGIYSLGDCAEVEGHVLPYVMPIMQAARTLASILAGHDSVLTYPAMPVMIKTPALPLVVSPPASGSEGSWTIKPVENGISDGGFNTHCNRVLALFRWQQTQGFFSSCVLSQCYGVGAVLCSHARNVLAYPSEILSSNISDRFGVCSL